MLTTDLSKFLSVAVKSDQIQK